MANKTFNIGEYTIGGRIKVETRRGLVNIQALDWNTKKEVMARQFDEGAHRDMDNYLNELTSSYYAGKVMDYIKTVTPVTKSVFDWI